jgi:hypothetical protein
LLAFRGEASEDLLQPASIMKTQKLAKQMKLRMKVALEKLLREGCEQNES